METTHLNGVLDKPAYSGDWDDRLVLRFSNGVSTHLEPIVTATQLDRLFALTALGICAGGGEKSSSATTQHFGAVWIDATVPFATIQ
jgi:hypothetical protein